VNTIHNTHKPTGNGIRFTTNPCLLVVVSRKDRKRDTKTKWWTILPAFTCQRSRLVKSMCSLYNTSNYWQSCFGGPCVRLQPAFNNDNDELESGWVDLPMPSQCITLTHNTRGGCGYGDRGGVMLLRWGYVCPKPYILSHFLRHRFYLFVCFCLCHFLSLSLFFYLSHTHRHTHTHTRARTFTHSEIAFFFFFWVNIHSRHTRGQCSCSRTREGRTGG
jgi:hypothetical protein